MIIPFLSVRGRSASASTPTVDIPAPTFGWSANSNGTYTTLAGCLSLASFSGTPNANSAPRGCGISFAGNGSLRARGNSTAVIAGLANESWTMAGFIRKTGTSQATEVIWSTISPGSGTFAVYATAGTITLGATLSNGTFRTISTSPRFEYGVYHWVVARRDAANGTIRLEVDGNRIGTSNLTAGALQAPAGNLTLGSHVDGSSPFPGDVGLTYVWLGNSVQPTATQLETLRQYNQGRMYSGSVWAANDTYFYGNSIIPDFVSAGGGGEVIFISDIGNDVDDAYDTHLIIRAHKLGLLTLRCLIADTPLDKGAPCLQAFRDYAGLSSIPIGAYQGNVGFDAPGNITDFYASNVSSLNGLSNLTRANYTDSTTAIRSALANCADGNATIVMTGFATAMDALLRSASDGIYAGNGVQLVAAKCKAVVWSAGDFTATGNASPLVQNPPSAAEWNIFHARQAAANVANTCPVDLLWSGYSMAITNSQSIGSGNIGASTANLPANCPTRQAQNAFFSGNLAGIRPPWGSLAIGPLVLGLLGNYTLGETNRNTIEAGNNGRNVWTFANGANTPLLLVGNQATTADYFNLQLQTDIA